MRKPIFLILPVLSVMFTSCTPLALNDYFGIGMNPAEKDNFIIHSYNEQSGISYSNSTSMNPNLMAWAELDVKQMHFVIINKSDSELTLNFGTDQYILFTIDDKSFLLVKGDRMQYEKKRIIGPGEKVELLLELPKDFWQPVAMRDQITGEANYLESFWAGENNLNFLRENIREIEVRVGETVILLKPVPQK